MQQFGGCVPQGRLQFGDRGRRRSRQEHAERLPRFHHQCARQNAYPISSFTWLLVPVQSKDAAKGKVLKDFLTWMLDKGEAMTAPLTYAPLPTAVSKMVREEIQQIH